MNVIIIVIWLHKAMIVTYFHYFIFAMFEKINSGKDNNK